MMAWAWKVRLILEEPVDGFIWIGEHFDFISPVDEHSFKEMEVWGFISHDQGTFMTVPNSKFLSFFRHPVYIEFFLLVGRSANRLRYVGSHAP
jgi:hypothetical protein